MDETLLYEEFLRKRITELRLHKNVSEHRMSLELGKSGSYIRGITSGAALPSIRELFNIIAYFDLTPSEFFAGSGNQDSMRHLLQNKLLDLNDEDLEKVSTFIDWIQK